MWVIPQLLVFVIYNALTGDAVPVAPGECRYLGLWRYTASSDAGETWMP
jgi:hypothetical protein